MSADLHEIYPTIVTINDFPCGSGKTTKMMQSLKQRKLYLIVVNLKSEIKRVLENTSHINLHEPTASMTKFGTKKEALLKLVSESKSIVTTHKLYNDIGQLAALGLLQKYHVIIDEVPEVITPIISLSKKSVDEFYISKGYLNVSDNGLCSPTDKWEHSLDDVSDTLNPHIKHHAEGHNLYLSKQGTFLNAVPKMLFYNCASMTVLTYKSEGSYFLKYLDKLSVAYNVNCDRNLEKEFKAKAKELITFGETDVLKRINFTYSKRRCQTKPNTSQSAAIT